MILREVVVADEPPAWSAAGFTVEDGAVAFDGVRLALAGRDAGRRVIRLGIEGLDEETSADGLALAPASTSSSASTHRNATVAVDHVVGMSPDLDRTVAALEDAGVPLRRIREEPSPAGAPRQAFFHLGTAILEVIQEPPEAVERGGGADRPARLWGLALVCPELEAAADALGAGAAPIRDAVQEGRRIMPLRREAGLALPVAFMSPRPEA